MQTWLLRYQKIRHMLAILTFASESQICSWDLIYRSGRFIYLMLQIGGIKVTLYISALDF